MNKDRDSDHRCTTLPSEGFGLTLIAERPQVMRRLVKYMDKGALPELEKLPRQEGCRGDREPAAPWGNAARIARPGDVSYTMVMTLKGQSYRGAIPRDHWLSGG